MRLTDEQMNAVDLAIRSDRLKIEAFAGSGKTTTLKAIGSSLVDDRGLYLAFNRSIAHEAATKFPSNVSCKTAHALAFASCGRRYGGRIGGRLTPSVLSDAGIFQSKSPVLAQVALDLVTRFCQSSKSEIDESLIGASDLLGLKELSQDIGSLISDLLKLSRDIWSSLIDSCSQLPVPHDVYLKEWILSNPRLPFDFVLFDEAQDANPALLHLLSQQNCKVVFVGDRYQQIYAWRGAVNAMSSFTTDNVAYLTQSFRFGDAIADVANFVLKELLGSPRGVRGFEGVSSIVGAIRRPRAVICRTNMEAVHWLIRAPRISHSVAMVGGTVELQSLVRGIDDLKKGRRSSSPDLSAFRDYDELVEYSKTEAGASFGTVLNLHREQGAYRLLKALEYAGKSDERTADMIVSTGHKAKGREWASVSLADDFRGPDNKHFAVEEGNLLYVAVTRAMSALDVSRCRFIPQASSSFVPIIRRRDGGYRPAEYIARDG